MTTKTKIAIAVLIGAAVALLSLQIFTTISLPVLLVILIVVVALYRVIPSRFDANFFILEIMLGLGFALAVITQSLDIQIHRWALWAWLGLSIPISIFGPILLRKFSSGSFH